MRARGRLRGARRRDALPLRPLHLAGGRSSQRRTRRVDHDLRARRENDKAPLRHARLPRHLSRAGAARECRGHGRPRLGRTDRARDGRGLDGTRASRVRLPVPGDARAGRDARRAGRDRPPALDRGARRLPWPPLHARGRARAAATRPAAEAAAARRRERRARHRRAGAPVRRRVQHAVRLSRGRGGDPGEDPAAALQRHDRLRHRRDARRRARACADALRPEATRRPVRRMARREWSASRSSARSKKRPSASAPTSTPGATASCSSTSSTPISSRSG